MNSDCSVNDFQEILESFRRHFDLLYLSTFIQICQSRRDRRIARWGSSISVWGRRPPLGSRGGTRRNSTGLRFYRDEESNYIGRRRRDAPRRPSQHRHGYQGGDEEETSPSVSDQYRRPLPSPPPLPPPSSPRRPPREIIFGVGRF